jgi:hypothetical protein
MESKDADELKRYLLTDFRDEKYKRASLIDIFRRDQKYFAKLEKAHKIHPDAELFFDNNREQLSAAESIREDAFCNLKYEQIIQDYVENLSQGKVHTTSEDQNDGVVTDTNTVVMSGMHEPPLSQMDVRKDNSGNKISILQDQQVLQDYEKILSFFAAKHAKKS